MMNDDMHDSSNLFIYDLSIIYLHCQLSYDEYTNCTLLVGR